MDKKNYDSAEDVDYALAPILEMEMKNEGQIKKALDFRYICEEIRKQFPLYHPTLVQFRATAIWFRNLTRYLVIVIQLNSRLSQSAPVQLDSESISRINKYLCDKKPEFDISKLSESGNVIRMTDISALTEMTLHTCKLIEGKTSAEVATASLNNSEPMNNPLCLSQVYERESYKCARRDMFPEQGVKRTAADFYSSLMEIVDQVEKL